MEHFNKQVKQIQKIKSHKMSHKHLVILLLGVILLSTQVIARPYYLSENHHRLTPSATVPSAVGESLQKLPPWLKKIFPKKPPKIPKINLPPPPPPRRRLKPPSSNWSMLKSCSDLKVFNKSAPHHHCGVCSLSTLKLN